MKAPLREYSLDEESETHPSRDLAIKEAKKRLSTRSSSSVIEIQEITRMQHSLFDRDKLKQDSDEYWISDTIIVRKSNGLF